MSWPPSRNTRTPLELFEIFFMSAVVVQLLFAVGMMVFSLAMALSA